MRLASRARYVLLFWLRPGIVAPAYGPMADNISENPRRPANQRRPRTGHCSETVAGPVRSSFQAFCHASWPCIEAYHNVDREYLGNAYIRLPNGTPTPRFHYRPSQYDPGCTCLMRTSVCYPRSPPLSSSG
ncbi:hypothetical protein F4777DRAFT_552240 [Nemania sp. FL0916]|nr:hypothetical protein F4777DRAFT_552240 [Nemania sp. FL0916]